MRKTWKEVVLEAVQSCGGEAVTLQDIYQLVRGNAIVTCPFGKRARMIGERIGIHEKSD